MNAPRDKATIASDQACSLISIAIELLEVAAEAIDDEEQKHSLPSPDQHVQMRFEDVAGQLRAALGELDGSGPDEIEVICSNVTHINGEPVGD